MNAQGLECSKQWWSWQDVMKNAPRLGIPHFQRGNVWDSANRVALLESMYHKSPCGSIVVWRQGCDTDPGDIGVSILDPNRPGEGDIAWVVDGQQRLRTLIDAFSAVIAAERQSIKRGMLSEATIQNLCRQMPWEAVRDECPEEDEASDSDDTGGEDPVPDANGLKNWYVCVPAIPELRADMSSLGSPMAEWVHKANVFRSSMFRRFHVKPQDAGGGQKTPTFNVPGLLPLGLFLSDALETALPDIRKEIDLAAGLENPGDPEHRKRLQQRIPWGPFYLTSNPLQRWDDISDPRQVKPLVDLLGNPGMRVLLDGVQQVFTEKRFAVDSLPLCGIKDAIGAYVRINRAGVRVRAEERAMAAVAARDRNILGRLAIFIRERDGDAEMKFDRSMLSHAAEKTFGFSLWMRTVARYIVLRCCPESGLLWMAPEDIERNTIVYALDRWPDPERDQTGDLETMLAGAASHATAALLLVDSLLSKELCLDHRMARPHAAACQPLIEVLSRTPISVIDSLQKAGSVHRRKLAQLLHLTLLHPYLDHANLAALVTAIHEPFAAQRNAWSVLGSEDDFPRLLLGWIQGLHAIKHPRTPAGDSRLSNDKPDQEQLLDDLAAVARAHFQGLVEQSRSLQHPAVGWLYALERRNNAREFDWDQQQQAYMANDQEGIPPKSIPTDRRRAELSALFVDEKRRAWHPERQHVVPFSAARKISNKGGTRATASPANNVGNLTWLSSRQNGFEYGFSDRWACLNEEREGDNLEARGFLFTDGASDRRAIDFYKGLYGRKRESTLEMFDEFCKIRRAWMVSQMDEWLNEWRR